MTTQAAVGSIPVPTLGDRMRMALRHGDTGSGEMVEYLGVSRGSVANWLGDRVRPSKQTLRLWALRCGVSFEWLETGTAPTLPSGPEEYTTRDSNPEPADLEFYRIGRAA